jgi:hypothetical protein
MSRLTIRSSQSVPACAFSAAAGSVDQPGLQHHQPACLSLSSTQQLLYGGPTENMNTGAFVLFNPCADYLRHPQYGGLLMASFGLAIITRSETRLAMCAVLWFVLHQKVRERVRGVRTSAEYSHGRPTASSALLFYDISPGMVPAKQPNSQRFWQSRIHPSVVVQVALHGGMYTGCSA